jgi:hypothetical protein
MTASLEGQPATQVITPDLAIMGGSGGKTHILSTDLLPQLWCSCNTSIMHLGKHHSPWKNSTSNCFWSNTLSPKCRLCTWVSIASSRSQECRCFLTNWESPTPTLIHCLIVGDKMSSNLGSSNHAEQKVIHLEWKDLKTPFILKTQLPQVPKLSVPLHALFILPWTLYLSTIAQKTFPPSQATVSWEWVRKTSLHLSLSKGEQLKG